MAFDMSATRLFKAALQVGLIASAFVHSSTAIKNPATPAFFRLPAAPGYQNRDACPSRCTDTGPAVGNWSVYRNFDQVQSCGEIIFYDFTLVDLVDDSDHPHRIYACTNVGSDWQNLPVNTTGAASSSTATTSNATYEVGYWPEASGSPVASHLYSLIFQLRAYLANGYARTNGPAIVMASSGSTSVGLYIGKEIQNDAIDKFALQPLEVIVEPSAGGLNHTSMMAMQYCQSNQNADHVFGLIATGNGTFGAVQDALASWQNATCLSFPESQNLTGSITFNSPLLKPSNGTTNSTLRGGNSTAMSNSKSSRSTPLLARADCRTTDKAGNPVQVVSGDSCAYLAAKCGISGDDFTKYNPGSDFCASLKPYQHVCCSSGSLPNFAPKPNSDGSCHSYTIQNNDNCANLAAEYSLTNDDLEKFNKQTWAWNGCDLLFVGTVMCLSSGTPPMPAPLSNAVCGPQKPGTTQPKAGTNISSLNPCPLNACCDVWGQCGVTADFCTDTGTGAPGTAKKGTNGCISNCGMNIIRSSAPATYRNIAFYEAYNLGRDCLYQTVSQIDTSKYTHVVYSFGTMDTNYNVQTGDAMSTYEFNEFKRLSGTKKIFSIGGWAFSTDPSTYSIFRNGVTTGSRNTMASNIARFINDNDLDGINIDWEYPGAPDIPGIPAASSDDGANYLAFLKQLRSLLPNKEISVCAPASYWYLRGFPIKDMAPVLDYIVYMTYDLHGQWDANNQWAQIGCKTGTCLRSDVNLTETIGSLVMVTKAGVPSNKVIVGVTSYGRSFAMAEAGCYGPQCTYLGSASDSKATPGNCTKTAGYIGNAEIQDILNDPSRVNHHFVDSKSQSNILVYDDTQWVGYMDDSVKAQRTSMYKGLAMGGVTDWAIDLQKFNDPPPRSSSWASFRAQIKEGLDPSSDGETRTGNWTKIQCTDPAVSNIRAFNSEQRWTELDCPDAWNDVITDWKNLDRGKNSFTFTESVSLSLQELENADCGSLASNSNCNEDKCHVATAPAVGAAAYLVWNSLVIVHGMYSEYHDALINTAATQLTASLADFENTFAPVPPPPDDTWIQIVIALVTLGASAAAAPFFNSILKAMPWGKIAANQPKLGIYKDLTSAMITFGASVSRATITVDDNSEWKPEKQAAFSDYLGQTLYGWTNATQFQLAKLFSGTDEAIDLLTKLTADGHLIEGNTGIPDLTGATKSALPDLEAMVMKAFYGYAIPQVWHTAATPAFVLDSGYACGTKDPLSDWMTDDTMHATSSCYDGELYYVVWPKGKASTCTSGRDAHCTRGKYVAPPGLDKLDGTAWGGITRDILVAGSVRTFRQNGNKNGGDVADPTNAGTLEDLTNSDITTPGYIRLPVCSANVAFTAWSTPNRVDVTDPSYPCLPLQGITDCYDYTFENQGSDASPSVSDCQTIINNIQNTDGEWTTGIGGQRAIASAGECKFGVQADGVHGDVTYMTGGQDIVNIVSQAIKDYGGGGKVGAKGTMKCKGDVNDQAVIWGIY